MPNACIDTNLWFYALARPAVGEETKHQAAHRLIGEIDQPLVTPQILNELIPILNRFSSFPRMRESRQPLKNWIPAFAGMTNRVVFGL